MALLEDYLYSKEFLFEAEQAEKYLQDKLKKKRDAEDVEKLKANRRAFDKSEGSRQNPAFNKARTMRKYRDSYGEVMPKTTSSEKKLAKAEEKEKNANKYAKKIRDELEDRNDHYLVDKQHAEDAARRHYRRTHRNESAEVELYEGAIDLV